MPGEQSRQNLAQVQERVQAFVAAHEIDCPPEARALDLAAEAGEIAKELLKGTAYGSRPFAPTPGWAEELADALFALLCLASKTGVDLDDALDSVLTKYSDRLAARGEPGSGR